MNLNYKDMNTEKTYLGIVPYDENSDCKFVGREEEIQQLYDRIVRNDYTIYYAASGEGKSSLIKAGLFPQLRKRDYFPIYIVFNEDDFTSEERIGDIVLKHIDAEITKYNNDEHNIEKIEKTNWPWCENYLDVFESKAISEQSIDWLRIRNVKIVSKNVSRENVDLVPLLVFDQFEEVFTKTSFEWTEKFFKWLEFVSIDGIPTDLLKKEQQRGQIYARKNFKVLFSFRTEYLGELDYWCSQKCFLPALQNNRLCLKQMTIKGANEVVALNEEFANYSNDIVIGCADTRAELCKNELDKEKDNACVHALILSVLCKTLCEYDKEERENVLQKLKANQKDTVNEILLKFYKEKLKDAGLDFVKDEKIISRLEDALIDENGKRKRIKSNNPNLAGLSEWVEKLCSKDNGLLKVVGQDASSKTIEIPHDRLCEAIDTVRKERQLRLAEKVIRQKEWMQFGVITMVFVFITYLVSSSFHTIHKFFDNPSLCDEEHSTCILMLLLVLFSPILTLLLCHGNSRSKRQNIFTLCTATISTVSFGALLYFNKSNNIQFSQAHIPYVVVAGLIISSCILLLSSYRLFSQKTTLQHDNSKDKSQSLWPLWGALLLIASYVFYLTVHDLSAGINEPQDSFWGILALPLLYTLFVKGFFHVETKLKSKSFWILIVGIVPLFILELFFYLCHFLISLLVVNWQDYGVQTSLVLIVTYCVAFIYYLWHSKTNNLFYRLNTAKRILISSFCVCITVFAFYQNLGYNPFKISPNSVVKVSSWRSVVVKTTDGNKTLYGILSAQGDTIIPCCLDLGENDSIVAKKLTDMFERAAYEIMANSKIENPFTNDTINTDGSVTWSNNILVGEIVSSPTLEEYLYKDIDSNIPSNSTFEDSIDYYSRKLFIELRKANINWLITGKKYDMANLPSYEKVEKLQAEALDKTMGDFMQKSDSVGSQKRNNMQIMEDQDLVDLECSFVRSMLLCMIKDRCHHQDYPELISLQNTFIFAFFPDIPKMKLKRNVNTNFSVDLKIDNELRPTPFKNHSIYTNGDVLKKRAFVWYDMFYELCLQDAKYNSVLFEKMYSDSLSTDSVKKSLNEFRKKIANLNKALEGKKSLWNIDVNELVDIFNLALNLYNPDYLQSVKDDLNLQVNVSEYIREDEQFEKLKKNVFDSLMICLNRRPLGLYNDCLEQTCKGIIIASAFRGYDIENNVKSLHEYDSVKNALYSSMRTIVDVRKQKQKLAETNKELQSILDSIIKITKKTK